MTVKKWLEINRKIDVYKIAREVIEATEWEMVKINRDQLMRNQDSAGNQLGDYLSKNYANFKLSRGQSGVVDLFLTGEYQRSIFVETNGKEYFHKASDWKADKLADKFGEKILGMQKGYHFENYRKNKFLPLFARKYAAARKGLSTM